ncbi:hypothetical protein JVT61DRAFT_8962 [Boletus reticuloceps]|uniref:Uncharacterized protein n=1 Tax=Boletus reticuloceps TaxID=495285 RepID=A0A8I3A559_9AGAM|nr:hypothetical protein JVT61DRAFT_8962 [Boletus reticuloceps]
MVAPQCLTERRVTRPSNATARPGLPDKPAPKRTSEQKRTDEEQVRQRKEEKKTAKEDAYQRISTMQAQMVVDQSEALKDRVPMRPKPRIVRKNRPAIEENEPVILPPRNPRPESSKEPSLREVLADVTRQRLAKAKARAEASHNSSNQQTTELDSCRNSKGLTNSNSNVTVTDVDDDSDELRYAMEHYKGNAKQLLPAEVAVAHVDVDELTSLMDPGNRTPQREQVSLKRKFDSQSDLEGDEVTTEPASEGEAMETDLKPRGAGQRLTRQNAVAIIEAPPIKKIKTESVEGADNVGQSITGNAPSGEIATTPACTTARFHKGSSVPKNARTKATKGDLPPLMQNDPDGKWTKNVLPSIILWYGDQASVWNIKDSDLEHVLISIVGVVYPSFADIDEMKLEGGHIYDLAVQRLVRWRHIIGNAAGHVVLTYLNENAAVDEGLTKEALATLLLKGRAFAYADFDPTDHSKAFQSDLILSLLGMTHLQDTIGWVEVPGLDLLQKCDHGIRGVLSLCTAALERALKLAEEGRLETTVNRDSETQASQEALDANPAPTRSIRANRKQPRTLNHATGKLSTKGSAFSHQNWGGQTTSYYVSIANRSAEMLGDVVARALLYLATRPDDDAESTPIITDELDPRAQMCKPALAPHDYSETMWVTL